VERWGFLAMVLISQESQVMFSAGYIVIPFILLILVLGYRYLRTYLEKRRENAASEPFENQS